MERKRNRGSLSSCPALVSESEAFGYEARLKAITKSWGDLVLDVKNVHNATSNKAKSTINQLLTIRNWAIGYYIVELLW